VLSRCLSDEIQHTDTSCVLLWRDQSIYGKLALAALCALPIPASSAFVCDQIGPGYQIKHCDCWYFCNAIVCKQFELQACVTVGCHDTVCCADMQILSECYILAYLQICRPNTCISIRHSNRCSML